MKNYFLIIVLFLSVIVRGQSGDTLRDMKSVLESHNFIFRANAALPTSGASVNVANIDNYLKLQDEKCVM